MSQRNKDGIAEFVAGAAISQYQQIKIDSSRLAQVCGAGDPPHGIAEISADSGKPVSVLLRTAPGTRKVIAAGACSVGDSLYVAATGQVVTSGSGTIRYLALEAASNAGDVIEALPLT